MFLSFCQFLLKKVYFIRRRQDIFVPSLHVTVQEVQFMKYFGQIC